MHRKTTSLFSSLVMLSCFFAIPHGFGALTVPVTNNSDSNTPGSGSLRDAINTVNGMPVSPPYTIDFTPGLDPIVLTSALPPIVVAVTIDGKNNIIDGNNTSRAFFVRAPGLVTINDLQLDRTAAIGGAGGSNAAGNIAGGGGGGGGLGAGGGIFVDTGTTVEINNVTFNANSAHGGAGGAGGLFTGIRGGGGGAGGGSMFGSGAAGGTIVAGDAVGGGGGGGGGSGISTLTGNGVAGGNGSVATGGGAGGAGGNDFSGAGGGTSGAGGAVTSNPGGNGGNGTTAFAGGGGGGGGVTNNATSRSGGNGGNGNNNFGGGGGSGSGTSDTGSGDGLPGTPGNGGLFGGGGGGSGTNVSGGPSGGMGGFGGGGGGGGQSGGGTSNFGGGTGAAGGALAGGGGSGAGLGGAVFVRTGGILSVISAGFPATSTAAAGTPGNGATSGIARGEEIFLMSGGTLLFSLMSPLTITTAIQADNLAGGGGLTQNGPATLTLSGANTYTGGTNINGGVLQVSSDGNLGNVSGNLTFSGGGILELLTGFSTSTRGITLNAGGGTIQTDSGVAATWNGVISGGGGNPLTKTGPGTLALAGGNTYSGGTIINAGILQISNDNNLGIGGALTFGGGTLELLTAFGTATITRGVTLNAGGGTIQTDSGVTATFNVPGIISGVGALIKTGPGTLILSAANTYIGGTIINAGTLQISSDGNLGNVVGGLTFGGGTLKLSGFGTNTIGRAVALNTGGGTIETEMLADVATFSGNFTGVGSLTKTGLGTLILTGTNSYSGGTVVSAGTLQGNTSSLQGPIQNNATLIFDQPSNGTYSGVLSGNGAVKKNGGGTLTFTGASTMIGTVEVMQGTLLVNNSLPADFTVDSGAILGGFGPIASIVNDGFVAPGSNSIGVLNVTGNYTQNIGGTLEIDVSGNMTSDRLAAGGVANLSGTLEISPDPGPYLKGITYDVVTASGGVVGTFDTVTYITSPTTFQLHYLPTIVQLEVVTSTIFEGQTINGYNAQQVANYLQGLTYANNTDLASTVFALASLTNPELSNALDQLHPAPNGAFEMVNSFQNSFLSTLFTAHPLECCTVYTHRPCAKFRKNDFWATPFLFRTQQDNAEGVAGFNTKSKGLATGFDRGYRSGWTIGGGVAYSYTDFTWNKSRGHGHIQSGILSLYTGFCRRHFDLELSLLGEINWYDISRTIIFPGLQRTAKSFHRGEGWTAHLGSGVEWNMGALGVRPFINVDYSYVHQSKYREHGAQSLNLDVEQKNTRTLRGEGGIDFTGICSWQRKGWVQPKLSLSWIGEIPLSSPNYRAALRDVGGHFTVKSFRKMRSRISPGASVIFAPYDRLAITFHYAAEISGQFLGQKADMRIERRF